MVDEVLNSRQQMRAGIVSLERHEGGGGGGVATCNRLDWYESDL